MQNLIKRQLKKKSSYYDHLKRLSVVRSYTLAEPAKIASNVDEKVTSSSKTSNLQWLHFQNLFKVHLQNQLNRNHNIAARSDTHEKPVKILEL